MSRRFGWPGTGAGGGSGSGGDGFGAGSGVGSGGASSSLVNVQSADGASSVSVPLITPEMLATGLPSHSTAESLQSLLARLFVGIVSWIVYGPSWRCDVLSPLAVAGFSPALVVAVCS